MRRGLPPKSGDPLRAGGPLVISRQRQIPRTEALPEFGQIGRADQDVDGRLEQRAFSLPRYQVSSRHIAASGWSDLHLALLWSGRCRMYGFSRGFSAKLESKESEWQRWHIVETSNLESLERSLEEGGYIVEHNEKTEPYQISQGRALTRSQTLTLTNVLQQN